jgi:quercetin 2,3-dioxygenase
MITVRKSEDRGHFELGWLDTYHTFSFDRYYDPAHTQFRSLRVINEDRVAPGQGFPAHSHRDMEIVTYILEGALEHRDSMGNGSVIRPGDVQRMTAGKGVSHSEFNSSRDKIVHLLQIWILPNAPNLQPSYEQKFFSPAERQGRLRLIASPDGREGSVSIHQDTLIHAALLNAGQSISREMQPNRYAWIQVARGSVEVNDVGLQAGDGAAVSAEQKLEFAAPEKAELLFFDLA